MNTRFFRAAALSLAVGLVGAAGTTAAFAQDQVQRYDYARDAWPYVHIQTPNQQIAEISSSQATDASAGSSSSGASYSPEALATQDGANW